MGRVPKLLLGAALVAAAGAAAVWLGGRLGGDTGRLAVTGTVEGLQVDVSPKITGRIVELAVGEGQPVRRGQLLARLDTAELEAELGRVVAAARTAAAELRNLEAGARREEIREAQARAARARAQVEDLLAGARSQELEQARAAVRNAEATRVWTERDFARVRDLYGKELVAAQEVDRARQAYEVAAANEVAARERLALLEAGARKHEIDAARAELRAAEERVALLRAGARPQEIEAARARVAEAEAAVALARARLDEARLTAPIDGLVLRKNAELGETVSPGASILTLLDPRDLWVRAYVPETDVGRLRVGQPAAITIDAFPDRTFPGTVSEIASEAEFTPKNVQTRQERVNLVFRIKVAVRDGDGVIKPGMPADVDLLP
jgi:multidrug resistance efflux pump